VSRVSSRGGPDFNGDFGTGSPRYLDREHGSGPVSAGGPRTGFTSRKQLHAGAAAHY